MKTQKETESYSKEKGSGVPSFLEELETGALVHEEASAQTKAHVEAHAEAEKRKLLGQEALDPETVKKLDARVENEVTHIKQQIKEAVRQGSYKHVWEGRQITASTTVSARICWKEVRREFSLLKFLWIVLLSYVTITWYLWHRIKERDDYPVVYKGRVGLTNQDKVFLSKLTARLREEGVIIKKFTFAYARDSYSVGERESYKAQLCFKCASEEKM